MQLGVREVDALGDVAGSDGDASSEVDVAAGPYTCLQTVSKGSSQDG